ncbi:hypothetical protein DOY81_003603 [Sarcophaga bullata]|nr:hypothetical protein DOY81_003603 [Sarcophaga bullata]
MRAPKAMWEYRILFLVAFLTRSACASSACLYTCFIRIFTSFVPFVRANQSPPMKIFPDRFYLSGAVRVASL